MLWYDRLKVMLRTMRYRGAWGFRSAQAAILTRYLLATRPTWRGGTAELNVYSPPVGSPGYGRYLQGIKRLARGEFVPLVAHVAITDRCPYACARCSNVSRSDEEPSLDRLKRLLEELRSAGAARVALTGGEPLLRADLPAIVTACSPDLAPVIFTSGYGLDKRRVCELQDAGLSAAYVSLDHFSSERHDRIRGAGSHAAAVQAIQAFLASGIYTAAQAVVEPAMFADDSLDRLLAFCRNLGVDEIMLLEPMSMGHLNAAELAEPERERLAEVQLRSARDPSLPKVSSMTWLESPQCLGCQAGCSFVHITTAGEVLPCDFVPLSFGNVYALGFDAILARLRSVLVRPSQTCLARRLRQAYGERRTYPLPWSVTQQILEDYDPGPPPALSLMK